MKIIEYRILCETDGYQKVYLPEDAAPPTTCPIDTGHIVTEVVITRTFAQTASMTDDNELQVVVNPSPGSEKNFYLPNMCSRKCWWSSADKQTQAALTTDGERTAWNDASHVDWIDVMHGFIKQEENLKAVGEACEDYPPVIETSEDGSAPWTARVEDGQDTYDYFINYDTGVVTFNTALPANWQVRATFYKAKAQYEFLITPGTGKRLKIVRAVIFASLDFEFAGDIYYSVRVGGNQVGADIYKTAYDFIEGAMGGIIEVPLVGGTIALGQNYRGMHHAMLMVEMRNLKYTELRSSYGMDLRITMPTGVKWGGTRVTSAFTCESVDE